MERRTYKWGLLTIREARHPRRLPVKTYCSILLWFLKRAVAAGSVVDSEIEAETARLPEGFCFALMVLPFGPCMALQKKGGRLRVNNRRAAILTKNCAPRSITQSGPVGTARRTDSGAMPNTASNTARVEEAGDNQKPDLVIGIKSLEAAFRLFTFRESTCMSQSRNRMVADGDIAATCGVVRILNQVEIYLLPAFLARRAVKRYRRPKGIFPKRVALYGRTVLGM